MSAWWARCPSTGTSSRRVGGCSTIRTFRRHKSDHSLIFAARGRSCAAVVRSSPLLSKIASRADDKRRMRGLRCRWAHITEHTSTRRDRRPRSGTRVHQTDTMPDMREHRAAGGVTRPADPDRRQVPPRSGARQPLPRPPTKPDAPPIEVNPPRLSKICDAGGRPRFRHGDRAGEGPQSGVRGCPEGGSRGRPPSQPRTVATERAQYGHPTVPTLDLSHCLKPSWSQSPPPTKATPLRCRG